MNKELMEQLGMAISRVRYHVQYADEHKSGTAQPETADMIMLLRAFDAQQADLTQLVQLYVGLMQASGKLLFFAKRLLSTRKNAKKDRAFIPTFALDELAAVVKECEAQPDPVAEPPKKVPDAIDVVAVPVEEPKPIEESPTAEVIPFPQPPAKDANV